MICIQLTRHDYRHSLDYAKMTIYLLAWYYIVPARRDFFACELHQSYTISLDKLLKKKLSGRWSDASWRSREVTVMTVLWLFAVPWSDISRKRQIRRWQRNQRVIDPGPDPSWTWLTYLQQHGMFHDIIHVILYPFVSARWLLMVWWGLSAHTTMTWAGGGCTTGVSHVQCSDMGC